MVKLQGNNLELTVFATGGGNTQRQRPPRFSLSLSLSAALTSLPLRGKQKMSNNNIKLFALSHIYTHMTFGLFTTIASGALGKHIHKYVPASGSLSGYIRHPAP